MPKLRPRFLTVVLRERRAFDFDPALQGLRVDRERGIIFSVKIVGRSSPNTHGVRGVDGTEYTSEALRQAAPLYEGINCNVDHPPRAAPDTERSAKDRFAWLENVKVQESGLYGDLHFLDPCDPLAVKMMTAAVEHPEAYALSHNAVGKGEVKGGKYVINEIPEVRSVDIVADGGSNRSLREGREMKITLRQLVETAGVGRYPRTRKLLEMYEEAGDMEVDEPSGNGGAGAEDMDDMDHLFQAFKKCVGNDPARAKKILALLKPKEQEEEPVEEADEEEEPEKEKETEESRKRRKLKRGEILLSEERARAMCKTAGIEATQDVLEAVKGATFDQALAVFNLAKRATAPGRQGSAPRSTSRATLESAAPAAGDAKAWAQRLLG
jgi:hypothetical protein